MRTCNRGAQMLITTAGAFTAFSLMTIAVGTDYWLYSPGVCRTDSTGDNETSQKNEEVLTHSGLWRQCCMEGNVRTDHNIFIFRQQTLKQKLLNHFFKKAGIYLALFLDKKTFSNKFNSLLLFYPENNLLRSLITSLKKPQSEISLRTYMICSLMKNDFWIKHFSNCSASVSNPISRLQNCYEL